MPALPILIADIGEIIKIALVLLFIVGPLLFRLFGGSERQPDRTLPRRRPQRPRPQGPGGPQRPAGPTKADAEIEAFLRRANAQRGGGPPRAVEVVPPKTPQRARRPKPIGDELIIEAEVLPEEGVQTRIQSSINTSDFAQRAERLGDRVEQSDDLMEAHLHGVFDRKLGSLSEKPAQAATADVTPAPQEAAHDPDARRPVAPAAAGLIALLRSPQGMRDAIVLREILDRPEQRW